MKIAILLAALCSIATVSDVAFSQTQPLGYTALKAEARRIDRLEGGEKVISNKVLFAPVRLNLKPFGRGSDALYSTKADEIAFVCAPALPPSFRGGWVLGEIDKHESGAEGSTVYTLSNCRPE